MGVIDPSEPEIVQLLRKQLRLAGQAMRTERAYVKWLRQFLNFCKATSAEQLQESDIRRFLTKKSVEIVLSESEQIKHVDDPIAAVVKIPICPQARGLCHRVEQKRSRLRLAVKRNTVQ